MHGRIPWRNRSANSIPRSGHRAPGIELFHCTTLSMIWVATRGDPPDATDEKRTDNAAQDDDEEEGVVVDHVVHHPHLSSQLDGGSARVFTGHGYGRMKAGCETSARFFQQGTRLAKTHNMRRRRKA